MARIHYKTHIKPKSRVDDGDMGLLEFDTAKSSAIMMNDCFKDRYASCTNRDTESSKSGANVEQSLRLRRGGFAITAKTKVA